MNALFYYDFFDGVLAKVLKRERPFTGTERLLAVGVLHEITVGVKVRIAANEYDIAEGEKKS